MKIGIDPVRPCSWGTVPLSDVRPVRSLKQKSRPCIDDTNAKPFIFPSAGDASTDDGFKAEKEMNIMEIFMNKTYKTVSGFVRAARHYMVEATGDYPEDALTGHYAADEEMETTLRNTGAYYYEDNGFNIDMVMDSHIYIYMED